MLKELYESIHFSSNLPVKMFISQFGYVKPHWHQSIELLMVLEGTTHANVDGESFTLQPEDIILINTNTIHEMESPGSVAIALQFSPEMFSLSGENPENLSFRCNSSVDGHPEKFDTLRTIIAQMVQNNSFTNAGTLYRNNALFLALAGELMTRFQSAITNTAQKKRKFASRMTSILEYIDNHYQENFSLSDLAGAHGLSVPYLSSFFNQQMGISFSQYYTNVKLEHAVHDLISSEDSIESIATANGFTEPHAFVRAFKKKYGSIPSAYRKQYQKEALNQGSIGTANYIQLEPSNFMHLLKRYLEPALPAPAPSAPTGYIRRDTLPIVYCDTEGTPLRHTFQTLTSVARASDLLQEDILNMIRRMQVNLHYRYIKFHGLFADEMMVVHRRADGHLRFNFALIDRVIENLAALGLKPWMQLSFMPTALASNPNKTVFELPMNTSPPADMEEWCSLVRSLVVHLIERFGIDEVADWPFCVWSEPDTPVSMFGWGNQQLFCEFYRRTYQTVKSVYPKISFGSPALLYMRQNGDAAWIRRFLSYTQKNRCQPDFLTVHYYADILTGEGNINQENSKLHSSFPQSPDDFHDFIDEIQGVFADCGMADRKIYLAEWNLTFSHRNLINDTAFKSCYIMKNLLENYDRLESFGYWMLTDRMTECPFPDALFHGGMGLMTYNGIRKPVFHALRFFNMVGDTLVAKGKGYFITRKGTQITVFTYNYLHYGSLFAAGDNFALTPTERYGIFDMNQKWAVSIPLAHLPNRKYIQKEYILNREHGSAFDAWLSSGALPLTGYEAEIMDSVCEPDFLQTEIVPEKGTIVYEPVLEPLEVRCTTFRPLLLRGE